MCYRDSLNQRFSCKREDWVNIFFIEFNFHLTNESIYRRGSTCVTSGYASKNIFFYVNAQQQTQVLINMKGLNNFFDSDSLSWNSFIFICSVGATAVAEKTAGYNRSQGSSTKLQVERGVMDFIPATHLWLKKKKAIFT